MSDFLTDQDVSIKSFKEGGKSGMGRIVQAIQDDLYEVQLYDDWPHITDVRKVYNRSWLEAIQ